MRQNLHELATAAGRRWLHTGELVVLVNGSEKKQEKQKEERDAYRIYRKERNLQKSWERACTCDCCIHHELIGR